MVLLLDDEPSSSSRILLEGFERRQTYFNSRDPLLFELKFPFVALRSKPSNRIIEDGSTETCQLHAIGGLAISYLTRAGHR
jgi:hypothetical protein